MKIDELPREALLMILLVSDPRHWPERMKDQSHEALVGAVRRALAHAVTEGVMIREAPASEAARDA